MLGVPFAASASEPAVVGFHDDYGYYGELWYPLHIDKTMGRRRVGVKGVDYDAGVTIDQRNFPENSQISWRVPTRPPQKSGVYGYPHISWGAIRTQSR